MAARHYTFYDKTRFPRLHLYSDAFYDSKGHHVGWLNEDKIHDLKGNLVGWLRTDVIHDLEGLVIARRGVTLHIERLGLRMRPSLGGRFGMPGFSASWSDMEATMLFEEGANR